MRSAHDASASSPMGDILLLVDCLVPTSLLASSAQATLALLRTLHGVFARMLQNPDLERYRRLNRDSATWQTKVAPCVYPLRLAEWGGFLVMEATPVPVAHVAESSCRPSGVNEEEEEEERPVAKQAKLLHRRDTHVSSSTSRTTTTTTTSAQVVYVDKNELVNVLDEADLRLRLCEVELMQRSMLPEKSSTAACEAERACQQLLRALSAAVPIPWEWERVRRWVYVGLLRARLTHAAMSNGNEEAEEERGVPAGGARAIIPAHCAEALFLNFTETLPLAVNSSSNSICCCCSAARIGSNGTSTASQLSTPHAQRCWDELLAFFERIHGLALVTLSDCLTVVEAQRSGGESAGGTASPLLTREERWALRDTLAARYRAQHQAEALQHYRTHTGEAYRRLTAEEQGAGVTCILDIASAMEQVALLDESQGFVSRARQEANRLHNKFKQDGDLVYLHGLADEWEERLEEAKARTGKVTVFLERNM